jgi:formylglycine-generating enzyme required for sulfatase activity/tRNA A-37 threonylcarbamoyl transferase component Bud32
VRASAAPEPGTVLSPGDRVGDWVLEDRLGEGGMGAVYRVHSVMSDRVLAALKILKPSADAEARTRFVREAEALSTLSHPAIVRVMAVGEDPARDLPYMAMELAHGDTLKARLQRGPLSLAEALSAFAPLASALEHAHAAGIFHRDVKPANIILVPGGGVKLVDFGIAIGQAWGALTASGHVGTFSYLPPEIFRGEKADPAAIDVYAFGQCLHEALTGQRPFAVASGLTPAAVAAAVGARKVQHPRLDIGEGFPQALREEIWRATDPNPAMRTTTRSLREVLEPLRDLVAGPPAEAMPAPPSDETPNERTTRVPDPPGPAYSDRTRQQWVQRQPFRGRRRGERIVLAAAGAVLLIAAFTLLPRSRGSAPGMALPDQGRRGQTWMNAIDGLEYAWVPPGRYRMGCTPGDANCNPAELPYQEVDLRQGFWIGRTEVTVAAYKRFANATGREMPAAPRFNDDWQHDDHPVVNVPWETAGAYCAWAGGRLPNEAEWEWAFRGGHPDWYYPWGTEEPVCQPGARNGARFDDGAACDEAGTERAGAYSQNPYGLFDVAGNAWEWCQDVWRDREPAGDARQRRVLRGGSWVNEAAYLRASIRSRWFEGPESRDFIGLRCLRDAGPP